MGIVEWFDKDESRQMRYSPSTLQFFWLVRKLFGGCFIRFMSGPKNESDILTGSSTPNRCGNPFERIYIFWNWKRFFLINLGILIDGDFKLGVLLLVFAMVINRVLDLIWRVLLVLVLWKFCQNNSIFVETYILLFLFKTLAK